MINLFLFISILGIIYAGLNLIWFLNDNYEKEEEIICRMKHRRSVKGSTLKQTSGGIMFYDFCENTNDNLNEKNKFNSNGKCA